LIWAWKAFALAAVCLLGLLAPTEASAGLSSCSLSTGSISFGSYDALARSQIDGSGTISATCTGTNTETINIELSGGNSGSCSTPRALNGGTTMDYQLYTESGRAVVWCAGTAVVSMTLTFTSKVKTITQSVTFYGRVFAAQNPAAGIYRDSLSARLRQASTGTQFAQNTVSAELNVNAACALSVGTLGFGSYSPGTTALGSANLGVRCTKGSSYNIALGAGQYAGGGTRRMLGPSSNYLGYELFRDSARAVLWGDGASFGAKVPGTGTGGDQSLTVHGRSAIPDSVLPGSYSDSVFVTVDY
jgi:spore coat protein U-like protein